jgi:hypothetical protein
MKESMDAEARERRWRMRRRMKKMRTDCKRDGEHNRIEGIESMQQLQGILHV